MEKDNKKGGSKAKTILILACILVVVVASMFGGALADRIFGLRPLDILQKRTSVTSRGTIEQKVVKEESVVIDVVDRVSPSVVTVSIQTPKRRILEFDPFPVCAHA